MRKKKRKTQQKKERKLNGKRWMTEKNKMSRRREE
jgi:hypothetical protein